MKLDSLQTLNFQWNPPPCWITKAVRTSQRGKHSLLKYSWNRFGKWLLRWYRKWANMLRGLTSMSRSTRTWQEETEELMAKIFGCDGYFNVPRVYTPDTIAIFLSVLLKLGFDISWVIKLSILSLKTRISSTFSLRVTSAILKMTSTCHKSINTLNFFKDKIYDNNWNPKLVSISILYLFLVWELRFRFFDHLDYCSSQNIIYLSENS